MTHTNLATPTTEYDHTTQTYDDWYAEMNKALIAKTGNDAIAYACAFHDWWLDDVHPAQAAIFAIETVDEEDESETEDEYGYWGGYQAYDYPTYPDHHDSIDYYDSDLAFEQ